MKVSASEVKDLLEHRFNAKRPLLLIGPAGLGKTSMVKQFAAAKGVNVYEYRAAYAEPGDLKGLCNPEDGIMKFLRPEDLPPETDENCILFFDEINRASTSVMNCILQASDGSNKIATHRLPKGCLVIAAVNPDDANHTVNMMDFALVNRFSVVTLDYDVGSVLAYAKAAKWHQSVITFLSVEKAVFSNAKEYDGQSNKATPRSFEYLSDMEKAGVASNKTSHRATACGLLGDALGLQYFAFASGSQPITWAEIQSANASAVSRAEVMSNPEATRADLLASTNDSIHEHMIARKATKTEIKKVVAYFMVIPADIVVAFLQKITQADASYAEIFQAEETLMIRLGKRLAA